MNLCPDATADDGASAAKAGTRLERAALDAGPESSWAGPAPIDMAELLDRCMGDRKFLAVVLGLFSKWIGPALEEVDAALRGKDADALARAAHGVKGAAANVSATAASRIAARLEEISRGGAATEMELWVDALKRELERCAAFARQTLGESDRA